MKIVYAGSSQYSLRPLRALINSGCNVGAVVTQPDRPIGRKKILTPTPVKQFAIDQGLPVLDFERLRDHVAVLASIGADLMITCAYGQILTDDILKLFPLGVYNLHASLLPAYRGASPIQAAIRAGEEYTGVTVMKTERELDSGAILFDKRCRIDDKTCGDLFEELSMLSAEAAVETVDILSKGEPRLKLQDEAKATYCKKIFKADAAVNFNAPARSVARFINAMSPSPAAFAYLYGSAVNLLRATVCEGNGACGEVLSADKRGIVVACEDGAVNISSIQFAGGKVICAADAANGRKIKAGDRFD
ncbi:MAG: methionyl-tRNA formyltransferase [Clostridia bacterium]|nr:methionyl-tRNA formyltransferase [Clostridia bacterium]